MSLLLDALKKAADDKKKNSTDAEENSGSGALKIDSPEETENDESLELELSSAAETSAPNKASEDFPEVDESALSKSVTEVNAGPDSTDHHDILEDTLSDNTPLDIIEEDDEEIELSLVDEDSADKAAQPEEESIESASSNIPEVDNQAVDKEQIIADKQPSAPLPADSITNNIESEKALSALINKSNTHSRREKLKQSITLGLLITLILIGSGLYFYIEMQTASQDLYISQSNIAPINREKAIIKSPVATENIQAESRTVTQPEIKTAPEKQLAKINSTTASVKPAVKPKSTVKSTQTQLPPAKAISIVRTNKVDPVHILLRDAYSAFHREDYSKSEQLYQKVIKREPKNRDAILGLSAIAIKQQRYEYARQKYQYLLKLNPKDSIATAGISSIKNRVDPQLNESQLKFMLKEQPDAAHLYFALGSLYSSQQKWPEAQSVYFSAWSAENKNADYAYNLAVSLDHLDKKKQALDFYLLSLKLKQASGGNFSVETTRKRIQTLQASNK